MPVTHGVTSSSLVRTANTVFTTKANTQTHNEGALVQLVRIHACHAWGHEFEPRTHRQPDKAGCPKQRHPAFFMPFRSRKSPTWSGCLPFFRKDAGKYLSKNKESRNFAVGRNEPARGFCDFPTPSATTNAELGLPKAMPRHGRKTAQPEQAQTFHPSLHQT